MANFQENLEQIKTQHQQLASQLQETLQRADMMKAQLLKLEGAAEYIMAILQQESLEKAPEEGIEVPAESESAAA